MKPDIVIENHFTLFLARPENGDASDWLQESAPRDALFFGGALVIEARYVAGFVEAAAEAGFKVK